MFDNVSAVDLLREIRAHDYTSDPADEAGASRIEAIKALDRLICSAQAAQLDHIGALRRERRELMPLGGADCRITLCPEPDGIAVLRVRGPAEQMVAVHNALDAWAQGLRSTGDEHTAGQSPKHFVQGGAPNGPNIGRTCDRSSSCRHH